MAKKEKAKEEDRSVAAVATLAQAVKDASEAVHILYADRAYPQPDVLQAISDEVGVIQARLHNLKEINRMNRIEPGR